MSVIASLGSIGGDAVGAGVEWSGVEWMESGLLLALAVTAGYLID